MGNSGRFINEAVKLSSFPTMLSMGLFPNAKEITESFAAFAAVRQHLKTYRFNDPNVAVVCPGDGVSPRTGALFAMRTAWNVFSVDPIARGRFIRQDKIRRLTTVKSAIEDWTMPGKWSKIIIVAVHSHATLQQSLKSIVNNINANIAIVAMPCCVKLTLDKKPDVMYDEQGVWSPMRNISIWRNIYDINTVE